MRFQVTFDADHPESLARFWALALGYVKQPPPAGFDTWEAFAVAHQIPEEEWGRVAALVDPDGTGPRIFFHQVPEGKTVKNRVHLDVNVGEDRIEEQVAALIAAGAAEIDRKAELGSRWVVMRDPEGNEFCVQ